jgi:ribosomal protein L18
MKAILHFKRRMPRLVVFVTGTLLVIQGCIATTKPVRNSVVLPDEALPVKASRNNPSVNIYTDAQKRVMHVVAKENDQKEVDFFVFDLEGTLVQNYKMKSKDHVKIGGLAKGSYIYRVFCGDNETASGNFVIK